MSIDNRIGNGIWQRTGRSVKALVQHEVRGPIIQQVWARLQDRVWNRLNVRDRVEKEGQQ
jgi:hypothetical protein